MGQARDVTRVLLDPLQDAADLSRTLGAVGPLGAEDPPVERVTQHRAIWLASGSRDYGNGDLRQGFRIGRPGCRRSARPLEIGEGTRGQVHADRYQVMSRSDRLVETGPAVSTSNASPLLAAQTSWDLKLSAKAAFLNGSRHALPATVHRR